MGIKYRKFEIKEEGGKEWVFKHYPNQNGKIVTETADINASLGARIHLNALIKTASIFMSDNTICSVEIKEGEE